MGHVGNEQRAELGTYCGAQMQMSRSARAFTLVELLVGLVVTSIILSAVATLAFALSSASTAGEDSAFTQARIRQATVYLSDLIGRCSLICAAPGNDLVIWKADNNGDGRINLSELVYIERGADCRYLHLCTFTSTDDPEVLLADLKSETTKDGFISSYAEKYILLVPDCNDAQFTFLDAAPPATGLLAITFGFEENHVNHPYEIVAAARCRAAHLLNAAGDALVTTDDD